MRVNTIYDHANPLNIDDVLAAFPTLSRTHGAPSTGETYKHIPTANIMRDLTDNGFALHAVTVSRTRKADRIGYEKHMLRFRKIDATVTSDGAPEIVWTNSHDGSSSWKAFAGYIRFICSNGMIAGSILDAVTVRHSGANVSSKVIDGTYRVLDNLHMVTDRVDAYRTKQLSDDAIASFVETAQRIRLGDAFDARRDAGLDLAAAKRSCMLEAQSEARARNFFSASYDTEPRLNQRTMELRGLMRLDDRRGYRLVDTVCELSPDGEAEYIDFLR